MRGKKRAETQTEIGTEKVTIFIKISINKSVNLTIELETLTVGSASITGVKKKKSSSSTTVIEVGREMRMMMTHADETSMTKYNEVKSRVNMITDDVDSRTKIESGRHIFECIRVRTDKVTKST